MADPRVTESLFKLAALFTVLSDNLIDEHVVPSADLRESRLHFEQRFLNLNNTYTSRNASRQSRGHHQHMSRKVAICSPQSFLPCVPTRPLGRDPHFSNPCVHRSALQMRTQKRENALSRRKSDHHFCAKVTMKIRICCSVILHTSPRR